MRYSRLATNRLRAHPAAADDALQRHRREEVLAAARVLLSAACLLAIYLDPTELDAGLGAVCAEAVPTTTARMMAMKLDFLAILLSCISLVLCVLRCGEFTVAGGLLTRTLIFLPAAIR